METSALAPKLGRKRDHTRDPEILEAALDVLAETGYDRMTVDMVAARAKAGKATVYRRWASKAELVVDAVACMKRVDVDSETLPDTGTLRGDLIAMMKPHTIVDAEKKLRVMAGLVSMLAENPELTSAQSPLAGVLAALTRAKALTMAVAAHRVGRRDAAERVADACIELARVSNVRAARGAA